MQVDPCYNLPCYILQQIKMMKNDGDCKSLWIPCVSDTHKSHEQLWSNFYFTDANGIHFNWVLRKTSKQSEATNKGNQWQYSVTIEIYISLEGISLIRTLWIWQRELERERSAHNTLPFWFMHKLVLRLLCTSKWQINLKTR